MELAIVDPARADSDALASILQKAYPAARIHTFEDPLRLIQHCLAAQIDVVFTEVALRPYPLDGLTLISMLRERFQGVKAFIVTQGDAYRELAASLRVDGYLLKPPKLSDLRRALTASADCLNEPEPDVDALKAKI